MRRLLLFFTSVIICALFLAPAQALDVKRFELVKGRHYYQISEGAAYLQTNNMFRFTVQAYADVVGNVLGSSVYTPKAQRIDLLPDADGDPFRFRDRFDDEFGLANNFPNGVYRLGIRGRNDGDRTMSFSLTGDAYPPAPILNNYAAAQDLVYNLYNELSWQPFAGGTASDFIQFQIEDPDGNNVWETPDFNEPGALTGLDTHTILPAGALRPNVVYIGTIRFVKVLQSSSREYPFARGMVGYFTRTEFRMGAMSTGLIPTIDRLQLWKIQRTEQVPGGTPQFQSRAWEFFSRVDAVTSNLITSVQLTLPAGETRLFETNSALDEFEYSDDLLTNLLNFRALFKEGPYTFDITRLDAAPQRSVINFPAGNFPPPPDIQDLDSYPFRPATEDLNVSWAPWTSATASDFIRVELFDETTGGKIWDTANYSSPKHLSSGATSITIPSTNLIAGHAYELQVHFYRVNISDIRTIPGAFVFGGFDARTRILFQTQLPDVPRFGVAEGQSFWQRGDNSYEPDPQGAFHFEATASGATLDALRTAQVTIPNNGAVVLTPDQSGVNFSFRALEDSSNSLASHYPTGIYQFQFETLNDGLRASTVNLATNVLPPLPRLRNFPSLSGAPAGAAFDITWHPWENVNTNTESVRFTLRTIQGGLVFDSEGDSGDPISVSSNRVTIPRSANLRQNQSYVGRLRFEQKVTSEAPTYPGARGTATVFSETVFYLTTLNRSAFRQTLTVLKPSGDLKITVTNLLNARSYVFSYTSDFKTWTPLSRLIVTNPPVSSLSFTNALNVERAFFRTELLP